MSVRSSLGSFAFSAALSAAAAAQTASPIQFVPRARLTGPGTARFGSYLTLSGDDLLVRSESWSTTVVPHQFVFHRAGGAWSQQAQFDIDALGGGGCIGYSTPLAIEDDLLAIGSSAHPWPLGRVWTSRRTGSAWSSPVYAEDDRKDFFFFGQSVLLRDGTMLAGAPNDNFPGEVEILQDSPSGWQLQGELFGNGSDHTGAVMAISGDTLAVADESGVNVYLEGASALDWSFQARVDPPGDAILQGLAVDGDTMVVATQGPAPSCGTTSAAGVYVFERAGTTWTLTQTLANPAGAPNELGIAVAASNDTIYVGLATAAENHVGAVHVFRRLGSIWAEASRLPPSPALPANAYFGRALGADAGTLAVGAAGLDGNPGEVQVFDVVELPPPQTYCAAKPNSQGCLPGMSLVGIPSATSPDAFLVRATNVINNKTGILLYSRVGAASRPYMGGTLCIAQPFRRLNAGSSHGNPPPNDCSGSYAVDFNARIRSGIDPSLQPGVQVWVQFVTRDPGDPTTLGLTDAATFTIGS